MMDISGVKNTIVAKRIKGSLYLPKDKMIK